MKHLASNHARPNDSPHRLGWGIGLGLCVILVLGLGVGPGGGGILFSLLNDAEPVGGDGLFIITHIRLPRTLGALLAGGLLGLAGAVAQGLFRNPLADPYLLGSASGASLGVVLLASLAWGGLAWGAHTVVGGLGLQLGLTGAAFVGSTFAVLLTLTLAQGAQRSLQLLLAGVVVGVVLGALTSLVLVLSPQTLQFMQSFMLGSTSLVGWPACALMGGVWLVCLLAAAALARALDGLALGEDTAASLGLPLPAMRMGLVLVLALATGAAVAQTGLIAFVGLAAPHMVRGWARVRHRTLLMLASGMGALLLGAADVLVRGLIPPEELPVGIVTAVLGGGYLLGLMYRKNQGSDRDDLLC